MKSYIKGILTIAIASLIANVAQANIRIIHINNPNEVSNLPALKQTDILVLKENDLKKTILITPSISNLPVSNTPTQYIQKITLPTAHDIAGEKHSTQKSALLTYYTHQYAVTVSKLPKPYQNEYIDWLKHHN